VDPPHFWRCLPTAAIVACSQAGGFVQERHRELTLVNNAGVAAIGSFADTTMEEFDLAMQTNVYGPYRVTKAFMPLLVAQKGRIVNIGSDRLPSAKQTSTSMGSCAWPMPRVQ
jgi:NAD(P)-dependent dehydrogenase (short-subunit alcohol dehydrogenase family)